MADIALIIQGNLFSRDFLTDGIRSTPEWLAIDDAAIDKLHANLFTIFSGLPQTKATSESQTEDDLIWPILSRLGWIDSLRQQNLAVKGRDDVPDGLLFASAEAKALANKFGETWKRYEHGLVLVESKRWGRPLDRRTGGKLSIEEQIAPSTQMLRYLRRADDITRGKLRWGILTNGARWRLYFQGARSISEEFFEIDLASTLGIQGHEGGLFALTQGEQRHWLRVFQIVFCRTSFVQSAGLGATFHQRALELGRFYEEHVAANLSKLVFTDVFPKLVRAVARAAPSAELADIRDASLVLLYRLLFVLYAEDRDLLPVRDPRYDNYSLRDKVRLDVGKRKDSGDTFSETASRYWSVIEDLCRAIDKGDGSIGLPPYNGGLFDETRTPLLTAIRLGDTVIADVIDALSFDHSSGQRKYINYRDLSVRQLGSIYERLLEHELRREQGVLEIRPNIFARKGSGSYYTPDDLVVLIIRETIEPLIAEKVAAFRNKSDELAVGTDSGGVRRAALAGIDPATQILTLRICDPAMGSGHFLVALVDYLTDQVIAAVAEAEKLGEWTEYVSPLGNRIEDIRNTIFKNATDNKWSLDFDQLDDRHIIRRMVLKRCVYGVDKNPMAVELAKVSLWLHTFTVGAPLSFLDHHLRCGDSLFGSWVRSGIDRASALGAPLLLHGPMTRATRAAASMRIIEGLTDAEIAEADRSKLVFDEVYDMTAPLHAFLSLIHAFDWLDIKGREDRAALTAFFDGQFGDPVEIALGTKAIENGRSEAKRFAEIFNKARELVNEERFLSWQIAFPGVWSNWESAALTGGFDAVIGNPPWDVYEFEDVAWFATRSREIALLPSDAERKARIDQLAEKNDSLFNDYTRATTRQALGSKLVRSKTGDYSLLNKGKLNLFKLFVERAMTLVKPSGMVGLLTPSGIASDKTAAPFFKAIATGGRLKALYDFENKKVFFPDVHASFKFCVFVASPSAMLTPAQCAFFLQDVSELQDPERCFPLSAADFARVNPNTGTAPVFRTRRDAALTTAVYGRLPVAYDRQEEPGYKVWPVQFDQMLNMTTDSKLFRTQNQLEEREGAWPIDNGSWTSAAGQWLPLYEGKMVQAFDHRAADIVIREANVFRPGQQTSISSGEKANPARLPIPRHFVRFSRGWWKNHAYQWVIGFKDITATTNVRTMIAAILPLCGAGHTLPVLNMDDEVPRTPSDAALITANLNALVFDYVSRQKVQTTHFSNYILEQIPVVPLDSYENVRFGKKSAAEIVREAVLELTYTSNDMAAFARDMNYIDAKGQVNPPFVWDERRRLTLRAKLDALYFHLYGIVDRDDVRYIYSTFPIVEREETRDWGHYASRELCLAWMNALKAGKPDEKIELSA
jgi:hypothetical protein